jgi:membrane protein DedA with SNARE-associated domain
MEDALISAGAFLAAYGYVVVFVWFFADQAALPIPSTPLLIAAGAFAATGQLDLLTVIAVAALASLLADSLWFVLGKRGGARAIGYVCKLSLEPDSCVATTRSVFGRLGPATLIVAKFLPGVQTLAPASAGFAGAPWAGFLVLDLLGALLFVVPLTVGGYLFQPQLAAFLAQLSDVSGGILLAVLAIAALYAAVKVVQWAAFFRGHRLRRLTCEELNDRINAGDAVTVVDLRQRFDYEMQPQAIQDALRIPINQISRREAEISRKYDVVLVCT